MNDRDRENLKNALSNDALAYRHQSFIKYVTDGTATGFVDRAEYKVFVEMTQKKDVIALAHALLNGVFTYQEYFDKIEMIIGWDLMIQGIMEGQIKAKKNGEDNDKEVDVNGDLLTLTEETDENPEEDE